MPKRRVYNKVWRATRSNTQRNQVGSGDEAVNDVEFGDCLEYNGGSRQNLNQWELESENEADTESDKESGRDSHMRYHRVRKTHARKLDRKLDQMSDVVAGLVQAVQSLVATQKAPQNSTRIPSPERHSPNNVVAMPDMSSLTTALTANSVLNTVLSTCVPFTGVTKVNPKRFIKEFNEAVIATTLSEVDKIRAFKRLVQVPNTHWDGNLSLITNNLEDYQRAFLGVFFSEEVQEGLRRQFDTAFPRSYEVTVLGEFFDMWHEVLTGLTYSRLSTSEVISRMIDKLPQNKRDILRVQDYGTFSDFKRRVVRIVKESDYQPRGANEKPSRNNSNNNSYNEKPNHANVNNHNNNNTHYNRNNPTNNRYNNNYNSNYNSSNRYRNGYYHNANNNNNYSNHTAFNRVNNTSTRPPGNTGNVPPQHVVNRINSESVGGNVNMTNQHPYVRQSVDD